MIKLISLILLLLIFSGCAVSTHSQEAGPPNGTRVVISSTYILQGDWAASIHTRQTIYPGGFRIRQSEAYFGKNVIYPAPGAAPRPIPKSGRYGVMY